MKNRRIEAIANIIFQTYQEIEKKIQSSKEDQKTKNILLFILRILRPVVYEVTNENYEVEKGLQEIGIEIDTEIISSDFTAKIAFPSIENWSWSYGDREAAEIILNVNSEVQQKYIDKMIRYVNAILLSRKNVRKLGDKKLSESIDSFLNIDFDSLKQHFRQEYIENISIDDIEKNRSKLIKAKNPETFRRYAPDLAIIAALQRQSRRKKTNPQ